MTALTGQARVPFGAAALEFVDASLACETCEELSTPQHRVGGKLCNYSAHRGVLQASRCHKLCRRSSPFPCLMKHAETNNNTLTTSPSSPFPRARRFF